MNREKNDKVLIVSYYGKFPEWMNIWLKSCELNPDFDFMIVTDIVLNELPDNVKIIHFSLEEFRHKLSDAAGFEVVLKSPYKLCDYRPLYGKALKQYIVDYTFWGHCDIDLIWGHLSNFITDDILCNYDLIGMYGHLMLYRNTEYMNNLYKLNGGTFSYKEVFSNPENYSFDEMSGMDLIANKNKVKHFKDLKIINVSPDYNRFKMNSTKSEPEYFVWEHGKILRIYGTDAQYSEEYAYFHFSGKKPENKVSAQGIKNANIYLSAKQLTDRTSNIATVNELRSHNEYISDINDMETLKKARRKKIRKILKKSMKQKIIYLKVRKGIFWFMLSKDGSK